MFSINKKNVAKATKPFNLLNLASLSVFLVLTSFTRLNNEKIVALQECKNPLKEALGYNVFVRGEAHLGGGDTEGPVAVGGDLTMNGIITLASHVAGENYFNGDSQASSLVINGKIIYDSGQGIHLNQGFVKVGNLSNSNVFDKDFNNASVNTRLTSGRYDGLPRVQVQRKQPENSVGHKDLIDFETAFAGFKSTSLHLSTLDANLTIDQYNKIVLVQNKINVLNLKGSELINLPYLTFENEPNVDTPVIINVDVSGDFEWNVFNINNIGDHHGKFILWNFFNSSKITLIGGGTLVGTLFAPESNVVKNSSGNINGQVIAANYYHNEGELHHHVFEPCIDNPDTDCKLRVDVGDDVEICDNENITLNALVSGESTCDIAYLWSTGETTSSIVVNKEGVYTVIVKDCENCEDSNAVEVRARKSLFVTVGEDQEICAGQEINLVAEVKGDCATSGLTYLWSTGETTKNIIVSPEKNTNYKVIVNGCDTCKEITDKVLVSVSSGITIDLGEDQMVCLGESVTLTSPIEADTYLWSTGETSRSITVHPIQPTSYAVEVTIDGCVGKDDVELIAYSCEGGFIPKSKMINVYPTFLKSTDNLFLNIKSEDTQEIKISLYNVSGYMVESEIVRKIFKGDNAIDIDLDRFVKLSSGIYMLKIVGNYGVMAVKRIVID